MSTENQIKKYTNQNRCRRCDRPLSNPADIYGWRCAQIVGINTNQNATIYFDEQTDELLRTTIIDHLSKKANNIAQNVTSTVAYQSTAPDVNNDGILNTGYDAFGVWHDWDAENFGTNSSAYKMLCGLNTAYKRANTYGHWSGDKERISRLAAILRVTDTNITNVIVMNNEQGAFNLGHSALLLINSSGQGFYFSYSAANSHIDDIGEMRFSILNAEEVSEIKDRSGEVYESVTVYGDRRWEKGKDAYDRFVWLDIPSIEAGKRMFDYATDIFSNPGHYNAFYKSLGKQCDYVVSLILNVGGFDYTQSLTPNKSYKSFKEGKTYWENQSIDK